MGRYIFDLWRDGYAPDTHVMSGIACEAIGSYFLCARDCLHFTSPASTKASTFVISDLPSHVIVARDIKLLIGLANMSLVRAVNFFIRAFNLYTRRRGRRRKWIEKRKDLLKTMSFVDASKVARVTNIKFFGDFKFIAILSHKNEKNHRLKEKENYFCCINIIQL